MKIRTGFVSNSSSSSFLMIGIEDDADFLEKVEEAERKFKSNFDDGEYGIVKGKFLTFAQRMAKRIWMS